MLKIGMSGEPVRILQKKLGVPDDGQFGPATDKALKDYQKAQGIAVDGIAGPDTFARLGLYELILLMNGSSGETTTITCLTSPRCRNFSAECSQTARPPSGAKGFL